MTDTGHARVAERVLVTGVLGCLGAWVARCVLDDGDDVVGYDLGDARHRLELVLGDDLDRIEIVKGDITELAAVERALDEHEITRVVHLAALQVPFVRANPPLGMHVNVAGTVNVFDAVSRRLDRIPGVMYASSSAVYNASDPSPAPETGGTSPSTLYGVSKLADEGIARVYFADAGVSSIGLRPYVVYGPGRDQGMTSGPTAAMLAAARGEAAHIGFSGVAQYDYAPDVARAAVTAAHSAAGGAAVYNTPGRPRRRGRHRRRDPRDRARRRDHLERRPAAVPAGARGGRVRPRRRPVPAHAARRRAWRRRSSGSGSSSPDDRLKPAPRVRLGSAGAAATDAAASARAARRTAPPRTRQRTRARR